MTTFINASITADDTQEMPRLVLHTRRIRPGEIKDLTLLEGSLCAYRLGGYGEYILGHITLAAVAKGNRIMVNFQPVPRKDMSLLPMWRELSEVMFAWYDVAVQS